MKLSRSKRSINNAIFATIEKIIGTMIPFFLRFALLKVLGEQYLGLNNLFRSVLSVLSLAEIGFGQAISFSMYKPIAEKDDEKVCALLKLYRKIYIVVGLLILIIGLLLIPYLDLLVNKEYPAGINLTLIYLIYLSESVITYLFFAHRAALLNAAQMAYISSKIKIVTSLLFFVLRIYILFSYRDYFLFILFLPLLELLNRLLQCLISIRQFPQYRCRGEVDEKSKTRILDLVKDIAIHRFGGVIVSSLGSIVISVSLGLTAVAIYGNYNYVVSALISIMSVCFTSVTANIGNAISSESVEKNYSVFKQANLVNRYLACVSTVCLFCLYEDFMNAWQGESLSKGILCVAVFTLLFFIKESRQCVMVFKSACGIWKADKYKPLVSGIFNLILNLLFVRRFGVFAPALSTSLCFLFIEIPWETWALFNGYFGKSSTEYYADMLTNTILTAVIVFVCFFLCKIVKTEFVIMFIIKGLLCFGLSTVFFYLYNKNRNETKELIERIKTVIVTINQ